MDSFTGHTIIFTKTFQEFKKNQPNLYLKYLRECPNWENINSIPIEFQELFQNCLKELENDIDKIKEQYPSIFK